jgi:hypothetical protein
MPRRTKLRRRSSGWSDLHRAILRTGLDHFDEFPEADRLQAWSEMRNEIMQQWITDHPGSRPWSWWQFDCPPNQFRTRVYGKRHQFLDPSFDLSRETSFGRPRYFRECDIPDGGVLNIATSFESESSFLRRSSLLTTAELKALSGKIER